VNELQTNTGNMPHHRKTTPATVRIATTIIAQKNGWIVIDFFDFQLDFRFWVRVGHTDIFCASQDIAIPSGTSFLSSHSASFSDESLCFESDHYRHFDEQKNGLIRVSIFPTRFFGSVWATRISLAFCEVFQFRL
jgi:hypothetical protein